MRLVPLALILGFWLTPEVAADPDLLAAYSQLRAASLDASRIAVAENLTLTRGGATFQFKSGTFYALEPVMGQVTALVFVGNGVFSLEPAGEREKKHLARLSGDPSRLEEPFRELVLFCSDSTFTELSSDAVFKAGTMDPKAASLLADTRKTYRDSLRFNLEARIAAGLGSPVQSVFLADIRGQKHGRFLFSVDPMSGESVSLTHYSGVTIRDTWVSYNPPNYPLAVERALVHTSHVTLDTQVDKRAKMEAEAVSEFTGRVDGPRMLYVQLAPSLRVSKVTAADGGELKFIQEAKDKDGDLWVILPKPLAMNEKYSWRVSYTGDGVIRKAGNGNYFVGDRDNWYPKIDVPGESFNDRATYHLTFRNPKELTLVATGKPVKKSVEGKIAVSEWETEVPYTVIGFNYGDYKTKSLKAGDQEITVYANSELGNELKELQMILEQNPALARANGISVGALNTTGILDRTLAESANALHLFTAYFGPLPYQTMSVTQQPAGNFGQSWPTLVFMPYTSFLDDTARHQLHMDEGRSRQFFQEVGAHEISHQWWGHLISWKDYHEQWLSEGFAQFSAGLYIHRAQGEKKFKSFLEADRQFIMSALPETTMRANDAGPIWMGTRLSTEKTEGAYRLIYAKGDFVLHMLRMMLYDFARGDDSRFIALMKDFVQTNAGKAASTADFKAICDKHFGTDMGWFFNQWVYGTDIPKITIEYQISGTASGAVVTVDVQQQNVPEGFRSVMPFIMRAKAGALGGMLTISQPTMHAELRVNEKPDTIEFNPMYSLLCDLDVKRR